MKSTPAPSFSGAALAAALLVCAARNAPVFAGSSPGPVQDSARRDVAADELTAGRALVRVWLELPDGTPAAGAKLSLTVERRTDDLLTWSELREPSSIEAVTDAEGCGELVVDAHAECRFELVAVLEGYLAVR